METFPRGGGHPRDRVPGQEKARRRGQGSQAAPEVGEAAHVRVGGGARVGVPGAGLVREAVHVADLDARLDLEQFLARDLAHVDTEPPPHLDVAGETLGHVLGNQERPAAVDEPAVAADLVVEAGEDVDAAAHHAHQHLVGVVLADDGRGASGPPRGDQLLLEQEDVLDAAPGEVEGGGGAVDAGADDDSARGCR